MTDAPDQSVTHDAAPAADGEADTADSTAAPAAPAAPVAESPPPPMAFGRQIAQLVIIPAAIAIVGVAVVMLFGMLAGRQDRMDDLLARLEQGGGVGRLPFDLQDPRHKDRWLAAYKIATMIPGLKDEQKRHVNQRLITILNKHVGPEEHDLAGYLLIAVGQLGQEGGLDAILSRGHADQPGVRQGAVRGVLSWADTSQARRALPMLSELLADPQPQVAAEAAVAMGKLATPADQSAVDALHGALELTERQFREVRWNAAVALAKLGDERGSLIVAELLLNRQALARLPADETAATSAAGVMPRAMQDRVIVQTLAAVRDVTHPAILSKIKMLADNDPSAAVQNAALKVLALRPRAK